jgi:hypothetical protein
MKGNAERKHMLLASAAIAYNSRKRETHRKQQALQGRRAERAPNDVGAGVVVVMRRMV